MRDRASLEALLTTLIDNGLQGIKVYHSEHGPQDTALYKELAAQFELIETGGSDYHGDNEPSIRLGTGKDGNLHLHYGLLSYVNILLPMLPTKNRYGLSL